MTATLSTPSAYRVTQSRILLSEWTKFRSLRSTMWSLIAALLFIIGFAFLVPSLISAQWPPKDPRELLTFQPAPASLVGAHLAQFAFGVLGVMFISGEYATGMIRASLAAVPTRVPMLVGKTVVFTAVSLVIAVPSVFGAFFIGQAIFAGKHINTHLSSPGVTQVVIGTALYITGVGLLGLALGALLRHTAGAISMLFGLLFVLPIIARLLPSNVGDPINKWLPGTLGEAVTRQGHESGTFGPWTGFAIFCLYLLVGLVVAGIALRRRDA